MPVMRSFAGPAVFVAASFLATRAAADDKLACVQAADIGQERRSAGKLEEARAALRTCARETCPTLVRNDCTQWLAEVQASMPTVVLRAEGSRGEDVIDVRVELDGQPLSAVLDGLPIEVDPGRHAFAARTTNGQSSRQEIVVQTGEKNRPVVFRFVTSEASSAAARSVSLETPSRSNAAAWIFAGIAVAGGASFGYFGLRGASDVREMRAECAGNCAPARVDAAYEKLLAADISLGVALASAGIATYFFLSSGPTATKRLPALGVTPLIGGASAVWLARF
jgi:hypothetical protein